MCLFLLKNCNQGCNFVTVVVTGMQLSASVWNLAVWKGIPDNADV
jgi:hypothetical protein